MNTKLFLMCVLTTMCTSQQALSEVVFTFSDVTGGVLVTAEGTFDVTGQSQFGFHGIPQSSASSSATDQRFLSVVGASRSYVIGDSFTLFDPPADFNSFVRPDFQTQFGDNFGLISSFVTSQTFPTGRAALAIPGFDMAGEISGSTVIQGVSLDEIRPVPQTLVWGQSDAQRVRIVVVPEPSSAILLGLSGLGLLIRRRRR
ncbi:MAG: PEP-CTERM sorting domain-containing protein [Planctomycetota bacterium]